jgi:hypothetical protein
VRAAGAREHLHVADRHAVGQEQAVCRGDFPRHDARRRDLAEGAARDEASIAPAARPKPAQPRPRPAAAVAGGDRSARARRTVDPLNPVRDPVPGSTKGCSCTEIPWPPATPGQRLEVGVRRGGARGPARTPRPPRSAGAGRGGTQPVRPEAQAGADVGGDRPAEEASASRPPARNRTEAPHEPPGRARAGARSIPASAGRPGALVSGSHLAPAGGDPLATASAGLGGSRNMQLMWTGPAGGRGGAPPVDGEHGRPGRRVGRGEGCDQRVVAEAPGWRTPRRRNRQLGAGPP